MKATLLINGWAVTLGDRIIGIGIHNKHFFNSKRELVNELKKMQFDFA